MAIPNLESREELAKWLAAREAQLSKWEAELKTKQQNLDAQEAFLAAKGKLCAKCQGALDPDATSPNAKAPPALPRTQAPPLQARTAPIGVSPFNSPTVPISPASTRAHSPAPASASQRVPVRPALSPTPVLPGRGPPMGSASASMRLPPRLPQPPTSATAPDKRVNSSVSLDVPEAKQNVDGGVGAFPGCLLEGFMIKKGAKVKNWKRRYFVLQESGKLMYFENSDGKKLLGQLQVDSESSVGIRGNGGEGEDGGFWVCPEPNGRIYELETGDVEIRDKWVAALNKLVGPMNKPRQWKQAKPQKSGESKPKVNVVVQVAGSFFTDGEQQSLEARIYPDEIVSDAIQRSVKLLNLLPRVQKDKLVRPLSLANSQGEILKPSQVVHPLDVVFLQEA